MSVFRLQLPEEANKPFYEMVQTSNTISDELESIQQDLFSLKLPRLFLWSMKPGLRNIKHRLPSTLSRWQDWDNKVRRFYSKPVLSIPNGPEEGVAFNHFVMDLRFRSQEIRGLVIQAGENFNRRTAEYENKRNFLIAWTSWLLAFFGLIWSLAGL